MSTLASHLLGYRDKLLAYIHSKVSDPAVAEDILQDSLLKALQALPSLRDEERLISWFYNIVNHTIIDFYRRRHAETTYLVRYATHVPQHVELEEIATLCACFRELMPTLKSEYAELIEQLELTDGDPDAVAVRLGITRNNLKVRRYRARQALRQRLEETCRVCAAHGCLDCTCRAT